VNETHQIPTDDKTAANKTRRFVLCTLVVLIVSFIAGAVSVVTGITSISHHTTSSGSETIVTHHTFWSRCILCLALAFHLVVIIGIFRRSLFMWRAVYALPVVLALLAGIIVWPQLDHSDPNSIMAVVVPLVILFAMGIWQSFIWRKKWADCDSYFTSK